MAELDQKFFSKIVLSRALKLIDSGFLEKETIERLSEKLGVPKLQLQKVFNSELNLTPSEYAETSKLELAKQLLDNTSFDEGKIALSVGFKDFTVFQNLFENYYHQTPSQYREKKKECQEEGQWSKSKKVTDAFDIKIPYIPPFRFEDFLSHLEYFHIDGVEKVENGKYYKTIHIRKLEDYVNGYIIVRNNATTNELLVTLSSSLGEVSRQVVFLVKNMFDLYSDPSVIYDRLKRSNRIIHGCFKPGTRIPGSPDDYEIAVRAILGQLISMKNVSKVLEAFCKKFGEKIETGIEGLSYVFPTPERIEAIPRENMYDEICSLHITRSKVNAIMGVTEKLCRNPYLIRDCVQPEVLIQDLLTIKGVGKWTTDYIALRAVSYSNVLMETDYNIRKLFEREGITDPSIFDHFKPWKSHLTVGLFGLRDLVIENPDTLYKMYYDSPLGRILIACKNERIIGLWMEGQKHYLAQWKEEDFVERPNHPALQKVRQWLDIYFKGEEPPPTLSSLKIILAPSGTKWRQDLWNVLKTIPYGSVLTFQQLSQKVLRKRGLKKVSPSAVREAISHNPIGIFIPCHRILGTEGVNTGYAWGPKIRNQLLKLERQVKESSSLASSSSSSSSSTSSSSTFSPQ